MYQKYHRANNFSFGDWRFQLIWWSKKDKKIDILWRSPLENSGIRPSQVVAGPWIVALRSRSNKIYIPGTRNLPQSRRLISSQFGCKNSCCYFPPPNSLHLPQMSALPVCTANAGALQTHTQPVTKEEKWNLSILCSDIFLPMLEELHFAFTQMWLPWLHVYGNLLSTNS